MSTTIKCRRCKKPLITKGHVVFNKEGNPYVLCPFANCQTINWMPFEAVENGNLELRSWVEDNKRK